MGGHLGSVKSSVVRGLDLLSSTPGITVVVGFPFIASPESPCASETHGLFLAVNGRTATAPSRPERGSLAHCQARILQWPTNPSILVQTCHVVEVTLFTPSRQVHTTTAKAWRSSPRTSWLETAEATATKQQLKG